MKVLKKIGIWFACVLVASGIIVAVGGEGRMGAIPAVLLEIAAFALARRLCKMIDGKSAEEPEEPEMPVIARTCADSTRAPDFISATYTYGGTPEPESESESESELEFPPQPSAKPASVHSKAGIILFALCTILLFVSVFLFCLWNDTQSGPFVCAESPSESSALSNSETSASEFLQQKAQESRGHIDSEFGSDAYGGSNYPQ